jgi:hypothetical protein
MVVTKLLELQPALALEAFELVSAVGGSVFGILVSNLSNSKYYHLILIARKLRMLKMTSWMPCCVVVSWAVQVAVVHKMNIN